MQYQLTFGHFYMYLNAMTTAVSAQLQLRARLQSVGVFCQKAQELFTKILHTHGCALCFCTSLTEFEGGEFKSHEMTEVSQASPDQI